MKKLQNLNMKMKTKFVILITPSPRSNHGNGHNLRGAIRNKFPLSVDFDAHDKVNAFLKF